MYCALKFVLLAPNEYLLLAMEREIRSLSMQPHGSSTSAPWRSITNLTLAVGIDYDYRDKKIFYTYEEHHYLNDALFY